MKRRNFIKFKRAGYMACAGLMVVAIGATYKHHTNYVEKQETTYEATLGCIADENNEKVKDLEQTIDSLNIQLSISNELLDRFINPIDYGVAAAPIYHIPLSAELQQYTYDTCVYYDIVEHYELILAMMWQESNFKTDLISSTDDYGIMQINICNHEYLRQTLGIVDFLDAEDSIESGIYIISGLLHKYDDVHKALMAYNMGNGGASKHWSRGNYTSAYSHAITSKIELIRTDSYQ